MLHKFSRFILTSKTFIPLLCMSLLMLGMGFINTVFSLKLKLMGQSSFFVGIITSLFYLGMFTGSFTTSAILIRVGHIRAYSAAAALVAFSILAPAMLEDMILWSIARFIAGYCLAALYIIIESWLLNVSTEKNRSSYLALYIGSIYGAQSLGQLFIDVVDVKTLLPFVFASLFVVLSVIPISVTPIKAPQIDEPKALGMKKLYKVSPTGVFGCLVAGAFISSTYGLLPVYVLDAGGIALNNVATVMSLNILGGVILQYPLGYLSDRMDRRLTIIILCAIAAVICMLILVIDKTSFLQKDVAYFVNLTLVFILGGATFCLYPISMNHVCDYIDKGEIIEATQGLTVAYGLGSVIGPLIIAYVMKLVSAFGFFIGMSILFALTALYTGYRVIKSKNPLETQDTGFIALPQTTPIVSELEPRLKDEDEDEKK